MLPAAARALAAALPGGWADPAAIHHPGRQARLLLDTARASIAASLTALAGQEIGPDAVWLTPTVQAGRRAFLAAHPGQVAVSAVEPQALLDLVADRARPVPVDARGRVDVDTWQATAVGCAAGALQAANPEVGTTQPVAEVSAASPPLLVDATQVLARLPVPAGWSALTAQASDWAGPPGLAVLAVRPGVGWDRPSDGGTCWIDGAPNVAAAVAAAMALESLVPEWQDEAARARASIDALRAAAAAISDVEVVGDPVDRLPHVATFSALYLTGESIVDALARRGLSVASGSACLNFDRPSHVLAAMGAFTGGNVRVSLPFGFAEASVEQLIEALPSVIGDLRGEVLRG